MDLYRQFERKSHGHLIFLLRLQVAAHLASHALMSSAGTVGRQNSDGRLWRAPPPGCVDARQRTLKKFTRCSTVNPNHGHSSTRHSRYTGDFQQTTGRTSATSVLAIPPFLWSWHDAVRGGDRLSAPGFGRRPCPAATLIYFRLPSAGNLLCISHVELSDGHGSV